MRVSRRRRARTTPVYFTPEPNSEKNRDSKKEKKITTRTNTQAAFAAAERERIEEFPRESLTQKQNARSFAPALF